MFILNGATGRSLLLASLAFGLSCSIAQAGTMGEWTSNGTGQVWAQGSANFSSVYAGLTSNPGHTVESPEAITKVNLAKNQFFVVGNQSTGPANPEMVHSGGIPLLDDPGNGDTKSANLANSIYNTRSDNGQQSFSITNGPALASLILGSGSALRVDTYQLGNVYVSSDPNYNFNGAGVNPRLAFFVSLMGQQNSLDVGRTIGNPEPATLGLTGLALLGALFWSRRRSN